MKIVRFILFACLFAPIPSLLKAATDDKSALQPGAAVPVGPTGVKPELTSKIDASDLTALRAKAERGNAIAQYNLGLAYMQGRQAPADPVEGFIWLTLAAEAGSTGKALETLLSQLTPEQMAEGRQRLEQKRANNPFLRPSSTAKSSPAAQRTPATSLATPPTSATTTSGTAVVSETRGSGEAKNLYDQLAASGEEKRQLATDLDAARKEIERLKADGTARSGMSANLAAAQARFKQAEDAATTQAAEFATVRSALEESKAELAKLKAELVAAQTAAAANAAKASIAAESAMALQAERTSHRTTEAALAETKTHLDEVAAKLAKAQADAEARVIAAEKTAANAVVEAALAQRNGELTSQSATSAAAAEKLASLTRDLAAARHVAEQSQGELVRTRDQLAAVSDRQAAADRRITESAAEIESLRRSAATMTAKLEMDAASQSREVAALQQKLSAAEHSLAARNQGERDAVAANRNLANTQEQLAAAEAKLHDALQAADRTATEAKSRSAEAEMQAQTAKTELAAQQAALAAAQRRNEELSSQLIAAQKIAADYQATTTATSHAQAEAKAAAARVAEMTIQIESMRREAAAASTGNEEAAASHTRELKLLQGKVAAAERALTERNQTESALRQELETARREATELATTKNALNELTIARQNDVASSDRALVELRAQLSATEAKLRDSSQAAEREVERGKSSQSESAARTDTLRGELAGLRVELKDARDRLRGSEAASANQTTESIRLRHALDESEARGKTFAAEKEQLNVELATKTTELVEQSKRAEKMTQEATATRAKLESATESLATIGAESKRLSERLTAAEAAQPSATEANARLAALTRELESAREEAKHASEAAAKSALTRADASAREVAQREKQLSAAAAEITGLREELTTVRTLEPRVRQLEVEKAALAARAIASEEDKAELARAKAAQAEADAKLSVTLRSFTLLSKERDDLNARVAALSAKVSATSEALAKAEAQVRAVASAPRPSRSELDELRARAAAAEQNAALARAELARANQALALTRAAAADSNRAAPTAREPARLDPAGAPSPAASTTPAVRTHTIAVGETLSGISRQYYGTPNRWPEILAANRDILRDERSLIAGRTLRIP